MSKNIGFLIGSLRKNSFNKTIAKYVISKLPDAFEADIIDIRDLPLYNQDTEFPTPNSVDKMRQQVDRDAGLWIVSPEYNSAIPGALKNALDWLSRPVAPNESGIPSIIANKPVAITGAGGRNKTANTRKALVELTTFMGMKPLRETLGIQVPGEAFMTDQFELSDKQQKELDKQLSNFLSLL